MSTEVTSEISRRLSFSRAKLERILSGVSRLPYEDEARLCAAVNWQKPGRVMFGYNVRLRDFIKSPDMDDEMRIQIAVFWPIRSKWNMVGGYCTGTGHEDNRFNSGAYERHVRSILTPAGVDFYAIPTEYIDAGYHRTADFRRKVKQMLYSPGVSLSPLPDLGKVKEMKQHEDFGIEIA